MIIARFLPIELHGAYRFRFVSDIFKEPFSFSLIFPPTGTIVPLLWLTFGGFLC